MTKDSPRRPWQSSPRDAINLAALRYYALEIEKMSTLLYVSDPLPDRPTFEPLTSLLAETLRRLHEFSEEHFETRKDMECSPPYVFCADGLCHPPGTCSS
jgi:hypothetical protein